MASEVRIPRDPPVVLDVDGTTVVCEHTHAEWWMRRLAQAAWFDIAVGAVPHLAARIADTDDVFDLDDAARLAIAVTELVTGMSWPRAVRLAATVATDWPLFEVWAATNASGIDLHTVPPRRTLAAAHAMLAAGCEKQAEIEAMNRRLDDPHGVPGITRMDKRRVFTMNADDIAALQQSVSAMKGGA